METLELTIITEKDKLKYTVEQPETDEEYDRGLAERESLQEKHGMIYFRQSEYDKMAFWTPQTKIYVDFIFINSVGDIIKIVHNAKPLSKKMYECDNTYAVMEINGGECEKFSIKEGDSVIHPKLKISSENKYIAHNFMFHKLTYNTLKNIDPNNIAFMATAVSGAMGYPGSAQLFVYDGKDIEKYMFYHKFLSLTNEERKKYFSCVNNRYDWCHYSLGAGNYLYIKKEFYERFEKEWEKFNAYEPIYGNLYKNWCRIAYTILKEIDIKHFDEKKVIWFKQKYYGIDTANLDQVLSPKWWQDIEYDDFYFMMNDGDYLDIKVQNTSETVLDIGIRNCKNNEVLEVLKYYKEKKEYII